MTMVVVSDDDYDYDDNDGHFEQIIIWLFVNNDSMYSTDRYGGCLCSLYH